VDAFGIGCDAPGSFPHRFQVGQFCDLRSVVEKVTQLSVESGGAAEMNGDDPPR